MIQQGKCDVLGKTLAQKHLRASLPGQTLEVQSCTEPEHLAAWPQQAAAPSTTPGTRTHLSLPQWVRGCVVMLDAQWCFGKAHLHSLPHGRRLEYGMSLILH